MYENIYFDIYYVSEIPLYVPFVSGSKPRPKQKREKTEEEKSFKKRAKYFLLTQLVSVVVFLTLLGPMAAQEELEMDDDEDVDYEY